MEPSLDLCQNAVKHIRAHEVVHNGNCTYYSEYEC